jgi:predicted transcriptional regulator
MPIKNTERKIKNQTNIHGHETPEELLKKREIKIRMINNEISN